MIININRYPNVSERSALKIKFLRKAGLALCFSFFLWQNINAQNTDSVKRSTFDSSSKKTFSQKIKEIAVQLSREGKKDFDADKASILQDRTLEAVRENAQRAKIYLRSGLDTSGIINDIKRIDHIFAIASDGVFTKVGTTLSFRNLRSSTIIINELLSQAEKRKIQLDKYHADLSQLKYNIDSLLNSPELFQFSDDSSEVRKYFEQIIVLNYEVSPIDSGLIKANQGVRTLLNSIDLRVYKLEGALEELELAQKKLASDSYKKDFGYLYTALKESPDLKKTFSDSLTKTKLTLYYYFGNNILRCVILFIIYLIIYTYIRTLKRIYYNSNVSDEKNSAPLIFKSPALSALVIAVGCFQFIFISPPFIFNLFFWLIPALSITFIFKDFISQYWMRVWLLSILLFVLAAMCNLLLVPSPPERLTMFFIAVAGTMMGLVVWRYGKKDELREKWIIYSIILMAGLELSSATCNLFGRYNLSKSLMTAGFTNVIIAIQFLWIVRLINEGMQLSFTVYNDQATRVFYLNYSLVGKKAPFIFYVALVFGWIILVGKNFPAFTYIDEPIKTFFISERQIGSYSFTVANVLLFAVILICATLISKLVSYFASDQHLVSEKTSVKGQKLGSWLLLVRIAILTVGILLAFRAVGFDLDKLTLVMGALGVGIGLGLQTLVNNLVSGLIIAFEKPVNVGDVIDLDGQSGKMKSIGFRSSVISTVDGANVIMPNGDLLNAHLINWSTGGNRKRILIKVGISYTSDLNKAKELIQILLDAHEKVSKNPAPVIYFDQFGSSAIEMSIYFWTKHMTEAQAVKSELILLITNLYREKGIKIPYPQQEIYLQKSLDL